MWVEIVFLYVFKSSDNTKNGGDNMKKMITIIGLIFSILLILLLVIRTTYSLIINVIDKDGKSEIIDMITIRELITDNNGMYINEYYDVIRELDITDSEANVLIDSGELNNALNVLLKSVVDFRLNNKNKMTNNEIYDLIVEAINRDDAIDSELKNRVINKSWEYIQDIVDYLYDIKTSKEVN